MERFGGVLSWKDAAVVQLLWFKMQTPLQNIETRMIDQFFFCLFFNSVLDLNAFERQNKAEGLGMVTEEGSSKSG